MKTAIRRMLFNFGLILSTFALSGCVVSVGSRVGTPPPPQETVPPPPVIVGDPAQAANLAEIDAAAQLNMDNARTEGLLRLADRPMLAPPVQVHLVNTIYQRLSFDNNKVQVLKRVIARPDFCDPTRHAIVAQLAKLGFDSNKQEILNDINRRMAARPAQP